MTRLSVPLRFPLTLSGGLLIGVLSLSSTLAPSQPPRNVQFGPNIMLGGTGSYEPAIAVNPLDPDNLVAGFFELKSNLRFLTARAPSGPRPGFSLPGYRLR